MPSLMAVMLVAGSAWIVFLSLFNVLVLNHTPDRVRARVLAVSTLVFQGAVAAGSAAWGAVAVRFGIGSALLVVGVGRFYDGPGLVFTVAGRDGRRNFVEPLAPARCEKRHNDYTRRLWARSWLRSNTKSLHWTPTISSKRFVNIDEFDDEMVHKDGEFTATWRAQIGTLKPLLLPHGQSTYANTNA